MLLKELRNTSSTFEFAEEGTAIIIRNKKQQTMSHTHTQTLTQTHTHTHTCGLELWEVMVFRLGESGVGSI
jgi:6-phosphogluconolactonase (cycloisomerase 2 family)